MAAQKNSVGAHSICARQSSVSLRADMESAPAFCFGPRAKTPPSLLFIIFYLLFAYRASPLVSSSPSIKFMHCTAAPELPLPRLSNRLISCICVPSGLARQ